jgi:hypothetical protein
MGTSVSPCATVSLKVLGWYRVAAAGGSEESTVKIITLPGYIIMNGASITFEETVGRGLHSSTFQLNLSRF